MSEVLGKAAGDESRSLLFQHLDDLSFGPPPSTPAARSSGGGTKSKGKRSKCNVGQDDPREVKKRNTMVTKDTEASGKATARIPCHDAKVSPPSGVLSTPPTLPSVCIDDLIFTCKQQQHEQQRRQQRGSPNSSTESAVCLETTDEAVAKHLDLDQGSGRDPETVSSVIVSSAGRSPQTCIAPVPLDELAFNYKAISSSESAVCPETTDRAVTKHLDLDQRSGRDPETVSSVIVTSGERSPQTCDAPVELDELAFKSNVGQTLRGVESSNLVCTPCIQIIDESATDNSSSTALAKAPETGSPDVGAEDESQLSRPVEKEGKAARRPAKKYRQAAEKERADGSIDVQVLCSQCRRDTQGKRQMSLSEFMPRSACTTVSSQDPAVLDPACPSEPAAELKEEFEEMVPADPACPSAPPAELSEGSQAPLITIVEDPVEEPAEVTVLAPEPTDMSVCHRCRRSLVVDHMTSKGLRGSKVGDPLTAALKRYKRQAQETRAVWDLTTAEAFAIMRSPCSLCGIAADPQVGRFNGLTRLKATGALRSMGPYAAGNVASACTVCNMIKGTHTLPAAVEICRSIATYRGLGSFGHFPERFVNNTSRRSRSCYLGDTARKQSGTICSKTHSLSNAQFNSIVANPCHYCGKASNPPHHHNGLDRLDNSLRVYNVDNAVSCCGTCNMAKGKLTEDGFLKQCAIISARAVAASGSDVEPPMPGGGGDLETSVPAAVQDMECAAGFA